MTREEAIEALTSKDVCNPDIMLEALEMAIKALEQEPSRDMEEIKKTMEYARKRGQMTEDTKRALEIIKPIADELRLDVTADEKILYINDIGIGISMNSTYATIMEFVGYLYLNHYTKRFRGIKVDADTKEWITRYWIDDKLLKKLRGTE